jgi:hypothetical protein
LKVISKASRAGTARSSQRDRIVPIRIGSTGISIGRVPVDSPSLIVGAVALILDSNGFRVFDQCQENVSVNAAAGQMANADA